MEEGKGCISKILLVVASYIQKTSEISVDQWIKVKCSNDTVEGNDVADGDALIHKQLFVML